MKIGHGIFGWSSLERHNNRYGAIHLAAQPYGDAGPSVQVFHDWEAFNKLDSKRVRITVRVLESRQSMHAGDHSLKIFPVQPEVGEEVDLGVGIFAIEQGYDGTPDIVLRPNDGRTTLWLDPHKLYRLHDQTVEVFAEETTDEFSVAPNIDVDSEPKAFDNGDGTFQIKNVREGDRILPASKRLGDGIFVLNTQPGEGKELQVDTSSRQRPN